MPVAGNGGFIAETACECHAQNCPGQGHPEVSCKSLRRRGNQAVRDIRGRMDQDGRIVAVGVARSSAGGARPSEVSVCPVVGGAERAEWERLMEKHHGDGITLATRRD